MFYFVDEKQCNIYFANGDIATFLATDPAYPRVIKLCEEGNWQKISAMNNFYKSITSCDNFNIDDNGNIHIDDIVINKEEQPEKITSLSKLINIVKKTHHLNNDQISLIKPFLENCFKNPYIDAVKEIYDYCTKLDFSITTDGCLLAYKHVNNNLTSVHDGTTKHVIGEYTEVEEFDTDRTHTCSKGLHFCSFNYLKSYSGAITICVKVNPADIVSIPTDYDYEKGRCKRYMTLGILPEDVHLDEVDTEMLFGEKVINKEMMDNG